MSPRAGRVLVLAFTVVGAGAAWMWIRARDTVPRGEPASAPLRGDSAPGLAAPSQTVIRDAHVATDGPVPAPSAEVERALQALVDTVAAGDGEAIQDAIETLSLAVCTEGGDHRDLLRRVAAGELTGRAARAVVLALGRCRREEVLRDLVAALKDRAASPFTRESLLLALAQPREAKINAVGRTFMGIEDAQIGGPIQERFVIDALLHELDLAYRELRDPPRSSAARPPELHRPLSACMRALMGSAGDDDVFDALVRAAGGDRGQRRSLLFSLQVADPSPRVTDYVRRIAMDRTSEPDELRGAMSLWMRTERTQAYAYVRSELASSDVTDVRKALIVASLDGFGMVPPEDVPALERLVSEVTAWARDHPKVVTRHVPVVGPEGTPHAPDEMDVVQRAAVVATNAYASARGPAGTLRTLALDAMVARLVAWSPAADPRRPARWLTSRFAGRGDEPFLFDLLERLRSAPVQDDTLVDTLDAVLRGDAASGPQAAAVLAAVAKVEVRLPPAARTELAERRRESK